MKICFVTAGSVNAYWEKEKHEECDVLVFGFGGLGEVDYRAELAGETSRLEDLALLSREMGCVAVSGCITDSCGMRRKSAAVAEKGRIEVRCEFCGKTYTLDPIDVKMLFANNNQARSKTIN